LRKLVVGWFDKGRPSGLGEEGMPPVDDQSDVIDRLDPVKKSKYVASRKRFVGSSLQSSKCLRNTPVAAYILDDLFEDVTLHGVDLEKTKIDAAWDTYSGKGTAADWLEGAPGLDAMDVTYCSLFLCEPAIAGLANLIARSRKWRRR